MFDEFSEEAQEITGLFEEALKWVASCMDINYKEPAHDIARRFLNEIEEFEPLEE